MSATMSVSALRQLLEFDVITLGILSLNWPVEGPWPNEDVSSPFCLVLSKLIVRPPALFSCFLLLSDPVARSRGFSVFFVVKFSVSWDRLGVEKLYG